MPGMSKDMINNSTDQRKARNCSIVGFQGKEANCHISKQLVIGRRVYQIHPIYDLYAASRDGKIIHIVKQDPISGSRNHNGYIQCCVRRYGGKNQKTYRVYRFVWECFHGIIPDGKGIDHINNNKEENRLCNLQVVTQQENCKKSAKNRDYSFAVNNHKKQKVRESN